MCPVLQASGRARPKHLEFVRRVLALPLLKHSKPGIADHPYILPQEVMREPVILSDGYSYERSHIEMWLAKGNTRSPMTNAELQKANGKVVMFSNHTLKALITHCMGSSSALEESDI